MITKKSALSFHTVHDVRRKTVLDYINSQNGNIIKFDATNTGFDSFSIQNYVKSINEILNKDRCHLTVTTIEGALITEQSLSIFFKWIIYKFTRTMKYKGSNTKPDNWFKSLNRDLASGKKSNTDVFNQVISMDYIDCELSEKDILFLRKISTEHIKDCQKRLLSYSGSPKIILNVLRVAFEGKTDNLLSRLHDDYVNTANAQFVCLVKDIRTYYFKTLGPIMGKTGGWVTDFLDFAIEDIEKNSANSREFNRKFAFVFPELFDIIRKVSSSIAQEDLHASRNG